MTDAPILYEKLEPILIAFIKTRIDTRDQILALFERLRSACGEAVCAVLEYPCRSRDEPSTAVTSYMFTCVRREA